MPYVEALGREMELVSLPLMEESEEVSSLYLGGGTPSLLSPKAIHRLFDLVQQHYKLAPDTEVTIEANPDDVTPEWIAALKATPINRISMGVQSLNDQILRTLRRRHTARQAKEAVCLLQDAGYPNLSLDLIYGLPSQTQEQFEADVRDILGLHIPHLSAYALQFEQGTPLYEMKSQGIVQEADEELSLACYHRIIDLAGEAGLEHYEISNFARPGFRSRHNSSYWTGQPYIGLGAGAHSYYPSSRVRCFNCEDIHEYIRSINQGRRPSTIEALSTTDRYNERVMLRLRTCEGLSLNELEHDFGPYLRRYCETMAEPHIRGGRLQKKAGETLCLTRKGLFVSDDIISDLMTI